MFAFKNVSKHYGNKAAVKDLSFSVNSGEVVALLGPNGAGKSTSMKMLTGYLLPTKGQISVCGFDVQNDTGQAQSQIGYLPEGTPLYTEATVLEFIRFAAAAREVPAKEQRGAVERVIEQCGLQSVRHQLIDTLSKGYRQRTCLAQSIVHDPQVLVLDEPTDGLDPNQKDIQDMIREMSTTKSILLSTHIMSEAEFMSDRILLINQGRAVAEGTMQELREQLGQTQGIVLKLSNADRSSVREAINALHAVNNVSLSDSTAGPLVVQIEPVESNSHDLLTRVAALCHEHAWQIIELKTTEAGLSEIFTEATRGES